MPDIAISVLVFVCGALSALVGVSFRARQVCETHCPFLREREHLRAMAEKGHRAANETTALLGRVDALEDRMNAVEQRRRS